MNPARLINGANNNLAIDCSWINIAVFFSYEPFYLFICREHYENFLSFCLKINKVLGYKDYDVDYSILSDFKPSDLEQMMDLGVKYSGSGSYFEPVERPAKRPRLNDVDSPTVLVDAHGDSGGILPTKIMNELVDFYHVNIHPWIPILHMVKFRERMQVANERPQIACILHAIIAVCIRFPQNEHFRDDETKSKIAEKSRQKVILDSTESFSVENLQALVILAFETVS